MNVGVILRANREDMAAAARRGLRPCSQSISFFYSSSTASSRTHFQRVYLPLLDLK
jgi:hypothetical protein